MGRLLAVGLLVAAVGVAVIAVNGPGTDKPKEADAAAAQRTEARTRASAPGDLITPNGARRGGVRVRMQDLRFVPASVSAVRGRPVRFVNVDDVAHTVFEDLGATSGKAGAIDSRRIAPGETFTFTPRRAGVVAFVCTLHPTVMHGRILVEAPAA